MNLTQLLWKNDEPKGFQILKFFFSLLLFIWHLKILLHVRFGDNLPNSVTILKVHAVKPIIFKMVIIYGYPPR